MNSTARMATHPIAVNRLWRCLVLLMLPLLAGSLAIASPLEVHILSPPSVVVSPSELITHVFQLLNRSHKTLHVILDFELPPGWIHLGIPDSITLAPSAAESLFATVIVPAQFTDSTTHQLVARVDGAPDTSVTVDVHARTLFDVRLALIGPNDVFAGQQVTYTLTVANRGNERDTYVLSGTSRRAWPISVKPERLTLEPGQVGSADVFVTVPTGVSGSDLLTVVAASVSEPGTSALTTLAPRVIGALAQQEPLMATVPARATARLGSTHKVPRLILSASGPVDLDGRQRLDLQLSADGTLIRSARVSYSSPGWRMSLGHESRTSQSSGPPKVTSLALSRWSSSFRLEVETTDIGDHTGSIWYRLGQLDLNARRRVGHQESHGVTSPRAESTLGISHNGQGAAQLRIAGSATRQETAGGNTHTAYLSGSSRLGTVRITGNAQVSEPGYRDSDGLLSLSAAAHASISNQAYVSGRVSRSHKVADEGWRHPVWTQQISFSNTTASGVSLSLQQEAALRFQDHELSRFDLRLSGSARLPSQPGTVRPTASVSLLRTADVAAGTTTWSGSAKATWPLTLASQGVTVSLEGLYNQPRDEGREHSVQAYAETSLAHGTTGVVNLKTSIAYNINDGSVVPFVSVGYLRFLSSALQLDAQIDWGIDDGRGEARFNVGLSYNFDLPLPIPIRGSVEGQLVSASPQVNVANRVVGIENLRTLTDHEGRFVFPALEPGTYEVLIQSLPAQVQIVPERALVTVRAGATSTIELHLIQTAGIDGVVHTDPSSITWGEPPSVGNLRVSLYQDEELLHTTRTRADGRFDFPDLLPGRYKVVLDTTSLPSNTLAGQTVFVVDLRDGRWESVEFPLTVVQPIIDFLALPPSASFTFSPTQPVAGEQVTFSSQSIVDFTRSIRSFEWDLGDGHTLHGHQVDHVYAEPGAYVVRLTVTDSAGETDVAERYITVK